MRTRKSNQTEKYSVPDYGLDVDLDSEQLDETPRDRSGDEAFDAEAEAEGDAFEVDDDVDVGSDPDPDADLDADDDNAGGAPSGRRRPRQRASRAERSRKRGPLPKAPPPDQDPTALTSYPTDSRQTMTRTYHGNFQKALRAYFFDEYFGPDIQATRVAEDLFRRWTPYEVLPSKLADEDWCPLPTPWVPEDFEESQARASREWHNRVQSAVASGALESQVPRLMNDEEAEPYLVRPSRDIVTLLGPYTDKQQQQALSLHDPITLTNQGLPKKDCETDDCMPAGYMFDVGGLVLSLEWAPRSQSDTQILAIAVSPHADQDFDAYEEAAAEDEGSRGIIQLWALHGDKDSRGIMFLAKRQPRLVRTLCFDWGRAKHIKWCPVPSTTEGVLGTLAVLCGDGKVRVVSVGETREDEVNTLENLESNLATLHFPDETKVDVASLAWVTTNRITTGHSDGSIALWSVYPCACLSRHALHNTLVHHIATGYPSQPYLVASTPVSGFMALLDFLNPSSEMTSTTNPGIVPQPNMLEWSDHIQGFFSLVPASKPLNSTISLFHSRAFSATPRRVLDGDALLCSLAIGTHHPFLLVAMLDGSVWVCNPLNRAFAPRHAPTGWKMKLFQHEYVPRARLRPAARNDAMGPYRGVSRIVQSFKPVTNQGAKAAATAAANEQSAKARPRVKSRKVKKADKEAGADDNVDDEGGTYADPKKVVLQEPLSRTMAMAWNPNIDFSTWAAFGIASGLVRVLDLGVEH